VNTDAVANRELVPHGVCETVQATPRENRAAVVSLREAVVQPYDGILSGATGGWSELRVTVRLQVPMLQPSLDLNDDIGGKLRGV